MNIIFRGNYLYPASRLHDDDSQGTLKPIMARMKGTKSRATTAETMRQRTPVRPPDRKADKTGEMESCTRDPKREWPNFTDRKDQRADRLT